MKILSSPSFLLGAILALFSCNSSLRAEEAKVPAARAAPTELAKPSTKLINLDFPGGSVAQFVAAIAKSDSGPFNIIGEKEEMEVILPAISIHNAEPDALYKTLYMLLLKRGLVLNLAGVGLCVLNQADQPRTSVIYQREVHSAFESFQLKPYLSEHSVDDIVAVIRAGWELDPAHERNALHIKFHPPTSVLLVSGPSDAIMLTKDILGQIKLSSEKNSPPPITKNSPPSEAEKK